MSKASRQSTMCKMIRAMITKRLMYGHQMCQELARHLSDNEVVLAHTLMSEGSR